MHPSSLLEDDFPCGLTSYFGTAQHLVSNNSTRSATLLTAGDRAGVPGT